jgi:hypothetical protein
LSAQEAQDFRAQFGDTWHLVQTMLGHARVETTKNVYLEPFRQLDVEILLAHAEGFPVAEFMAQAFPSTPRWPVTRRWRGEPPGTVRGVTRHRDRDGSWTALGNADRSMLCPKGRRGTRFQFLWIAGGA